LFATTFAFNVAAFAVLALAHWPNSQPTAADARHLTPPALAAEEREKGVVSANERGKCVFTLEKV